ncbi:5-demethoxyubiquinone hydroxylase-like protein [Leptotrombidium deliense]|uniref:5-demethoxyubiquinone hydroxylase, mitochondrial n=1 Tax=Leptotrombidium deliense TaxID=299467 RepID=A0A443SFJ1_9ACAR|nr:5-demethoxyubiquinone hydroxylase-like protein [Leptotrombidium deliense]
MFDKMLRVDHSGELGADRIYCGQMYALRLKNPEKAAIVQKLWDQEKEHYREFNYLILKHRARRSLLTPIWNVSAFMLGYMPSLLGYEAAMATSVAVEKVITDHYNEQIRELIADDMKENNELIASLSRIRDDEQEHHDTGLAHDAERAPLYKYFSFVVETITKTAVKVAQKI